MAGTASSATVKPPRMTITNTVTGAFVEAPVNPPEFEESLEVAFQRQTVPGLSHQVMQFTNTGNYKVELELEFLAESPKLLEAAQKARSFLFSCCYPKKATDVPSGAPPRLLFLWPGMVSITCFLTKITIKHDRFNRQAQSYHFKAKLSLEEVRDVRLLSEEVAQIGTQRSGTAPGSIF